MWRCYCIQSLKGVIVNAFGFDWELASKFIPLINGVITFLVTVFLYNRWHRQKGKEVIANEAKQYIYYITELDKIQFDMNKGIEQNIDIKNTFHSYKSIREKLTNHAVFLSLCLRNNDLEYSYLSSKYLLVVNLYIENINDVINENKSLNLSTIPSINDSHDLSSCLLKYALYEKI